MGKNKGVEFLFGVIFILSLISFVSANCVDYDGLDKYTASYIEGTSTTSFLLGKTFWSDGTYSENGQNIHLRYDRCIFDGTQVQEAQCRTIQGKEYMLYSQFVCENGCENGACVGGPTTSFVYYCDNDNDGHKSSTQSGIGSTIPAGCSNLAGDDCNDEDSTIFPGNVEICDNKDNNCDGSIDEYCGECISGRTVSCGTNTGLCQTGLKTCVNGVWGNCEGAINPEAEICDSLDHNCDGSFHLTNTGSPISRITTCGVGICSQNQGQQYCLPSGTWGLNTCNQFSGATAEICTDNLDNDCDGLTDCSDIDDCSSNPYCASCECTLEGECNPTNNGQKCDGCNYYSVSNVTEICDLVDDNCDGSLTENPVGVPLTQPTTCGFGICSNSGFEFCQLNGSFGADNCQALLSNYSMEQNCSDGIDEDCDGLTDCEDTQDCGSLQECGGCECSAGCHPTTPGYVCDGCNYVEATGGDVCDGQDNDCDGVVDEGEDNNLLWTECYTGPSSTLGLGRCTYGFSYCTNGEYESCIGQKLPLTEICNNGIDDNCNGLTDCDDEELCEGMPGCEICVEGECNPNNNGKRCIGGQYVSVNDEEVCDGVDNNCDGNIDKESNGVALNQECYDGPFATQGVGICETGTSYCVNGNYGGCINQVLPSLELCNNELDDDCDGLEDLEDLQDCEGTLDKYYCDNDADTYISELFSGEGEIPAGCSGFEGNDCNDNNPNVNVAAEEICNNGIDDDCDGNSDCNDEECFGVGGCSGSCVGEVDPFIEGSEGVAVQGNDQNVSFYGSCLNSETFKLPICNGGQISYSNYSCEDNIWGLDSSCIGNNCRILDPIEDLCRPSEGFDNARVAGLVARMSSITFEFGGEEKYANKMAVFFEDEGKLGCTDQTSMEQWGYSPKQGIVFVAFPDDNQILGKGGFVYAEPFNWRIMDQNGEVYKVDPVGSGYNKWYPLGLDHVDSWANITLTKRYYCDEDQDNFISDYFTGECFEGECQTCQNNGQCSSNNCLGGYCIPTGCVLEMGEDCNDEDPSINSGNPPIVEAGQDMESCAGATANILLDQGSSIQGYSTGFSWITDGQGSITYDGYSSIPGYYYNPSLEEKLLGGVINFTFNVKSCGGVEVTDTKSLVISEKPQVTLISPNISICESNPAPIQLNSIVENYDSLLWTTMNGEGEFNDPTISNPIYNFESSSGSAITLSLTAQSKTNSCPSVSKQVSIPLINAVYASAGPDVDFEGDFGDSINLTGLAYGDSSFEWKIVGTNHGTGYFDNPFSYSTNYYPSEEDLTKDEITLTVLAYGICGGYKIDRMKINII